MEVCALSIVSMMRSVQFHPGVKQTSHCWALKSERGPRRIQTRSVAAQSIGKVRFIGRIGARDDSRFYSFEKSKINGYLVLRKARVRSLRSDVLLRELSSSGPEKRKGFTSLRSGPRERR